MSAAAIIIVIVVVSVTLGVYFSKKRCPKFGYKCPAAVVTPPASVSSGETPPTPPVVETAKTENKRGPAVPPPVDTSKADAETAAAKAQAEQQARQQAEQQARDRAEQQALAGQRAADQVEREAQAARARQQAEQQARQQAEQQARDRAEQQALADQRARDQAEREARARQQAEQEAQAARARQQAVTSQSFGGGGGGDYAMNCPSGMMKNISGRGGWWVDQLKGNCTDGTTLNPVGGQGGGPVDTADCPSGYTGVDVTYGQFVGKVTPKCGGAPISTPIGGGLGSGGGQSGSFDCPGAGKITGISGKAGSYIDSMKVTCSG
jgi:hypothetical protein